jgi:hypothetical protein
MERLHTIAMRVIAGIKVSAGTPRPPLGCVAGLPVAGAASEGVEVSDRKKGARLGQGSETEPRCAAFTRREDKARNDSALEIREAAGSPAGSEAAPAYMPHIAGAAVPSGVVGADH